MTLVEMGAVSRLTPVLSPDNASLMMGTWSTLPITLTKHGEVTHWRLPDTKSVLVHIENVYL